MGRQPSQTPNRSPGCGGAKFDAERNEIATLTCHGCKRSVAGFVWRQQLTKVIDHDYNYALLGSAEAEDLPQDIKLAYMQSGGGMKRQY